MSGEMPEEIRAALVRALGGASDAPASCWSEAQTLVRDAATNLEKVGQIGQVLNASPSPAFAVAALREMETRYMEVALTLGRARASVERDGFYSKPAALHNHPVDPAAIEGEK